MSQGIDSMVPEAGLLSAITDAIGRFFGGGSSVAEAKPWLWPEAIRVADYVLEATDRSNVVDRLDEALEEWPLLPKDYASYAERSDVPPIDATALAVKHIASSRAANRARLTPILGGAVDRWEDGWRGLGQLAEATHALFSSEPFLKAFEAKKARNAPSKPATLDFFYTSSLPVGVRKATWNAIVGLLALLAIQRAYEQQRRLEPWLALALCDVFAEGLKGLLLSFAVAFAETAVLKERDAGLERLATEARNSGAPVYTFFGDGEGG